MFASAQTLAAVPGNVVYRQASGRSLPLRVRGIPGGANMAQAAHASASIAARKSRRDAAARVAPTTVGKAAGERCDGEPGQPPRPAGKAA